MRGLNLCPVVLAAWLTGAGTLPAGVYLLDPTPTLLPPLSRPWPVPFENVRQERENLRGIHDPLPGQPERPLPPGSYRPYYLQMADWLQLQREAGFFSARDAVTLSGCLIRLGRLGDAVSIASETLSRLDRKDSVRFLLLLNRACAYQQQNDPQLLERALEDQGEALRCWPDLWAGWDQEQWRWQRRVEQLTRTWMRLRLREQLGSRGSQASLGLDPIFDTKEQKVRFIGPAGTYEAGGLAFQEENKLPRDAENLVVALLLAYPFDERLYWLYGELLNAHGQVGAARNVLVGLVGSGALKSRDLTDHRRALVADQAAFTLSDPNNPDAPLRKLFWAMAPRGHLLGGGLADMSHEAAWLAVLIDPQQPGPDLGTAPDFPASPPGADSLGALPRWRETSIGFAAGVVVGLLAALQWLEWRRRRREARR